MNCTFRFSVAAGSTRHQNCNPLRVICSTASVPIRTKTQCKTHRKLERFSQIIPNAVRADQQAEQLSTATLELISEITRKVDEEHAATLERNRAALESLVGHDAASELKQKILATIQDLKEGLLEREMEVRLLLLAALAGEHLLLLGPPGTAKSELARRMARLTGGRYFERLLTRFSVPEELFGPLSMKGLEDDQYVRQIDGYLPTSEVAFIDEIFKANSAILNALLTLLNERLFDNGNQRLRVPLLCLVGASNELPESEELDALYDRFLIRRHVAQVSSAQLGSLARLAAGQLVSPSSADGTPSSSGGAEFNGAATSVADGTGRFGDLTLEEFRGTAKAAYRGVELPDAVVDILTSLRNYLQDKCEPPVYVSDRRFMKAVNLLQVAAYADGRDQVHEYDCLLLEHVFGQRPDDAHKVKQFVLDTIASDPGLQQTELVFLGLFGRACRVLEGRDQQELEETRREAAAVVELLDLRQGGLAQTLDGNFPDLRTSVWQSEGTVQAAVQALTPQMTENKKKVEELLREALILQAALSNETEPGLLERLLPKRYKQYQKGISSRA
ncbi:probable ATPase RavA [Coccomyxa sp. Obi]|nr:probable ATPase RavA [Coccomyxa sp. Obi]